MFWLDELEREQLIERYSVDGVAYLRIEGWHEDQTIQHPSASKWPASPNEPPPHEAHEEPHEGPHESPHESRKSRRHKQKSVEPIKIHKVFSGEDGEPLSLEEAQLAEKANLDELYQAAVTLGDLPTATRISQLKARIIKLLLATGATSATAKIGPQTAAVAASDGAADEVPLEMPERPPNGMPIEPS